MFRPMSWLTRPFLCAAVAALTLSASPADANKNRRDAQPVAVQVDPNDLTCLAEALYYEARGEGVAGQQAVAEVILNRVDHPRFPGTVCGVVNQRGQFSYKGRVSGRFHEQGAYRRAQSIAVAALTGAPRNLTGGATYFHTRAVNPKWARTFTRTTRIGSHIFYRSGASQRVASN